MSQPRNSFFESTEPKDERLAALKQLYPELFADGKLNLDVLKEITTGENPQEARTPGYYGLYWPNKHKAKIEAKAKPTGTLEPVAGDGVNEDTTHNIYIEGENLEVLRILKESYKGRVKMIYIDPPYNTGDDFIYPDNYRMVMGDYLKMTGQVDEKGAPLTSNKKEDGAFHTKWLKMMMPRLMLARELLTEDGVIFISIDDNEQANLKLLCDEVFGEENFVNCICVKSRASISNDKIISPNHNFLLFYTKNIEKVEAKRKEIGLDPILEGFTLNDNDGRGEYRLVPVDGPGGAKKGNPYYEFQGISGYWRFSKETMQEKFDNRLVVKKGNSLYQKYFKITASETRRTTTTWWDDVGLTSSATTKLKALLEAETFDTPKPIELLYRTLQMITHNSTNSDIILDFFSGSATTAHATMQLNAQDNGKRRFIIVQLQQPCDENSEAAKAGYKNIAEIGKERIRRAGKKIREENALAPDLDTGFRVYHLAETNFNHYTPVLGQDENAQKDLFTELENQTTPLVPNWKPENLLTEIILRQGFALDCSCVKCDNIENNTVYRITDSDGPAKRTIILFVCLDTKIEESTIKTLTLTDGEKFICLDSAIDDTSYARLSDKGRIETL